MKVLNKIICGSYELIEGIQQALQELVPIFVFIILLYQIRSPELKLQIVKIIYFGMVILLTKHVYQILFIKILKEERKNEKNNTTEF